jgi:hypothetical protein
LLHRSIICRTEIILGAAFASQDLAGFGIITACGVDALQFLLSKQIFLARHSLAAPVFSESLSGKIIITVVPARQHAQRLEKRWIDQRIHRLYV